MSSRSKKNAIEIQEVKAGKGRPGVTDDPTPLALLSVEGPCPQRGDILWLHSETRGTTAGSLAVDVSGPFRVVEREQVFLREAEKDSGAIKTVPAAHLHTRIYVRRMTTEGYAREPGSSVLGPQVSPVDGAQIGIGQKRQRPASKPTKQAR